uniref:glutathione transferase n=1 Tax=Lissorhoptrus oryzophilus TaxID=308863 RepID=A0A2R4FXD6_9CUCU|nr:glutathione S-transferase s7 [Lissorhoptrus oryzophilus]
MSTTNYKLTYFDLTGLAESIRYLLYYGKIPFEDKRVSNDEREWISMKSNFPLGQLPVLEIENGKVLYQSISIHRYLAKKVGLMGNTDLENWEIDAAVETISDLRVKVYSWFWLTNQETKKKLKESVDKEGLPFLLDKLESWAVKNNGYIAVGKLTWADLYFAGMIEYLNYLCQRNILEKYPTLSKVKETVENIPTIKTWVDKRAKDHFFNLKSAL